MSTTRAGDPATVPPAGQLQHTLLEREHELDALTRALERTRAGAGALVVVRGEGGLGKSDLLATVREQAGQAGLTVLVARGDELEHGFPFGVALQLFEGLLRDAAPERRDALLEGPAALAGALADHAVPAPAAWMPGEPGTAGAAPAAEHGLVHGLYWLTANLAARGPVALLVDDAHWADAQSLRFLAYLGQRLHGLGALVVVTGRASEPGGEDALLDRLAAVSGAVAVAPRALSLDAATELLTRCLPAGPQPEAPFVTACHEVTGGNPLLLRELAGALREEGVAPTAQGAWRAREIGPAPVSRSLTLTLSRLGEDATRVARSVAVLGDDAQATHVARLARLSLASAVEAVDALARAGVFVRGKRAAFAHPIQRAAVYEELEPGERSLAHNAAARVTAEYGAAPERVAAHLAAAQPAGDAWAVESLDTAARTALARGAPAVAAGFLRRALEEPPPPESRAGLLMELGRAEAAAGDPAAPRRLEEALALVEDPARRAEVRRTLGRALFYLGRDEEAARAFEQGLDEAPADSELALELAADYAQAGMWSPPVRARAFARLTPLLPASSSRATTAAGRLALANVAGERLISGADREHVIALALRAWDGGALLGGDVNADIAVFALAGVLTFADAFDAAGEVIEAGLADTRRRGAAHAMATMSLCRARLRRALGSLDEAVVDLESVVEAHRDGWDVQAPGALGLLSFCHLQRGDRDAAAQALTVSAQVEVGWRRDVSYATFLEHRGWLALADGDPRRALEAFRDTGRLIDAAQAPNPSLSAWRGGEALALHQLGEAELAAARGREEVELARRFGAPRALACALRTAGLVRGGEEGIVLLREAVAVLEGSPAELDRAHALIELGAAQRRAGRRTEAREPLREGLDLADRCSAGLLAGRAREELASAGARPRRARLSGPEALTATERRVAGMAASGMTNREIARELYVTVKAVQWHLGNAYRKLEVKGREGLAAALG
ncbi:MAG: AAA family ATPase [Solirubrobacteraceae bacterium]